MRERKERKERGREREEREKKEKEEISPKLGYFQKSINNSVLILLEY
jgi:phage antirepressor YoqD-like protein